MSQLQDSALRDALNDADLARRLVVTPLLDDKQVGPASVDLRLGTDFIETRRRTLEAYDPFREPPDEADYEEHVFVPLGNYFTLHPGQFVLGSTLEFIRMPHHLAGQVLGRSSWGRLGLLVATAVVVQPGFDGSLTLELVNMGSVPIFLYPGVRVAQLAVWTLVGEVKRPYSGSAPKYRGPLGPQTARLRLETEEKERIKTIGQVLNGERPYP